MSMPPIAPAEKSEPWKRVLAGSRWLLIDRTVRMGFGFLVSVALARLLGPSRFGTFVYATAMAALFQPLVSLGMERIVIRDLVRFKEDRSMLLGTATLLRFLGGGVGLAVLVGASAWSGALSGESRWVVTIIAAGNVFMAADVVDWAFQARGHFGLPVVIRVVVFILAASIRLFLAASGASLLLIADTVLGEFALVAILLGFAALRGKELPLGSWSWNSGKAMHLLALSWPLLLAEIAIWVFQRLDLVMLQHFEPGRDVGWFASASRLTQAAQMIPVVAVQVLAPEAARTGSLKETLALTGRAMRVLAMVAYAVTFATCFLASWLVPLLFGEAYDGAVRLVMIMSWSNVFVYLGCCHAMYLVTVDLQRISLYLTWTTAAVSLVLNLLLIPRWHGLGAAVASLAAYGITAMFGVLVYEESRPLFRENLKALIMPVQWAWHRFGAK